MKTEREISIHHEFAQASEVGSCCGCVEDDDPNTWKAKNTDWKALTWKAVPIEPTKT